MKLAPFSKKQLELLSWWHPASPSSSRDAVICDGAIRSGKTLCMSLSFCLWALSSFDGAAFALCGKTISSLRRNMIAPLLPLLREAGFAVRDLPSKNQLSLSFGGRTGVFYLFGGRDEDSASYIQGITLAGVLLDETALMPRSFVEQALARCSLPGARFWFNCNPDSPSHWFYKEWILKASQKNALYLHFTMDDNPALSPEVRARYDALYSGRFRERFILGRWVRPEGLVYPDIPQDLLFTEPPPGLSPFAVSCDYGTVNPTSMGLWGHKDGVWYRLKEFYYDSRQKGSQLTDEEYSSALSRLADGRPLSAVIVDPSASSFIQCLSRRGFPVVHAENRVLDGIRRVSSAMRERRIRFSSSCTDLLREFSLYVWDDDPSSDHPVKAFDHAMDDLRYFVSYAFPQTADFYVKSAARNEVSS